MIMGIPKNKEKGKELQPMNCSCGAKAVVRDKLIGGMNVFPYVECTDPECRMVCDLSDSLSLAYSQNQYRSIRELTVLRWNQRMTETEKDKGEE